MEPDYEKIIKDAVVYDSIFSAFRHFAPSSVILELENDVCHPFRSSETYELMQMPDGKLAALPRIFMSMGYRGENGVFEHCEASIFRNLKTVDGYDSTGIAIDEVRIIEFENILKTFPQIKAAEREGLIVDYMALAQHYELNTPMLDITAEPAIAAYFATQRFHDGVAEPICDGIGCIRGISTIRESYNIMQGQPSRLHTFGMQAFHRPGLQMAFGLETKCGEDLSDQGWRLYFRQTRRASEAIYHNFHLNLETHRIEKKSWLFPDEDIVDVAAFVKRSTSLSEAAVRTYCDRNNINPNDFAAAVKDRGIKIVSRPIYELSPSRILELTKETKDAPYGDVKIMTRLMMLPPAK